MALSITDMLGLFIFAVNKEAALSSAGSFFHSYMSQYIPDGGGVI